MAPVNTVEAMEVIPTGKALAAEVRGIDFALESPEPVRSALRKAWADNLVLLFRKQTLTDEQLLAVAADRVPAEMAGLRTSLFVDAQPAGLFGLVGVGRRLRRECPWDRAQTHSSLVGHLLEEVYELIEAISGLPRGEEVDYVAYDAVEEELGDVLLQILFHAAIAAERGAFDLDDVATRLTAKLIRRHPHVFGDVEVADAAEVAANWEAIKQAEKGGGSDPGEIPPGLPALERAKRAYRALSALTGA